MIIDGYKLTRVKFKPSLRLLLFGLGMTLASRASAQQVILRYDSTLMSVTQESVPPNDSGGRWVETTFILTSHSALPVRAYGFVGLYVSYFGVIEDFRFDDSDFYRADSIFPDWNPNGCIGYDKPWERMDSITKPGWLGSRSMSFLLPPFGTVRVPVWTRLIRGSSDLDTVTANVTLQPFSDSTVGPITYRRYGDAELVAKELDPCAAPYQIDFGGLPLTNSQYPGFWQYSRHIGSPTDTIYSPTSGTYQIVGEYSNRFDPPTNVTNSYYWDLAFTFHGAPQKIVHDTLISTLTDCYGTVVTLTPIEAYSSTASENGYSVKHPPSYFTLKAPFLGSATDTIITSNLSPFPIQVKNISARDYDTVKSFQIVSAPNVIGVNDSGAIVIALVDNDLWADTYDPERAATISGTVVPYQTDWTFLDSTFSFDLSGLIDVYCPYTEHYLYAPPAIKHGVHPAGIVFSSDSISTSYAAGKSFLTTYGNHDSVSEYFYTPYYDDQRFHISIGNFDLLGSATLPGMIDPDTQRTFPDYSLIELLTQFTGDDQHNYRTQLHWPRANDTISIDVVALGASAPPFNGVTLKTLSDGFSIWPNPASSILHVSSVQAGATIAIYDLLGRELLMADLSSNNSLDISNIPDGVFSVVLNSKSGTPIVEMLTVVR